MGSIVVGLDGSESSLAALRWALAEAVAHGHEVRVVQAWEYPAAVLLPGPFGGPVPPPSEMAKANEAALADSLALVTIPEGVTVNRIVREGPAAAVLLDEAARADHLVLGTRGRGGFAGLVLGSVTQHLAGRVQCPVTVIHG